MGLGRLVSAYSSHPIPAAGDSFEPSISQSQGGKPTKHIEIGIRNARYRDGFVTEPYGIMEVAR